jgi:peptidyl-prolyl cis-trans isomerase A (cyclophilin A)/peptidyl-prolyl cis-trans isomerase B (cyclophilin B)
MGRDSDPHSATTEFFINLADNSFFDYAEPTPRGWGYCVFGRVAQGWDVVEKLAATPILTGGDFIGDVPAQPLALEQARLLTE